jgi:Histidine kinase-, DNA gyrase B-, and HSP90-like ATPase
VLLKHASTEVQVSVIDTGEGIAPEFLPYIFDRFQQGDASTTRRHGGLGLGLAIVKQLVELHGGNVRIQSDGLGKGATFNVHLPLTAVYSEPEKEGHLPDATVRENPPMPEVSLADIQVLVVDDEIDANQLRTRGVKPRNTSLDTSPWKAQHRQRHRRSACPGTSVLHRICH